MSAPLAPSLHHGEPPDAAARRPERGWLSPKLCARVLMGAVCVLCAWPVFALSMKHYLPTIDNDEVIYFLEIKAFRLHGFNGGNFFLNDQVPASRIHSGLHGPVFIAIYGLIARLIGWQNYSPYVVNVLIFLAAWLLLWRLLKAQAHKQIAVAVFVLMHGYFFLFLPCMMQESFHISVAVAMAAIWTTALERPSRAAWAALFALTSIAMLTRYLWGVTVPFFLFTLLRQRIAHWPRSALTNVGLGVVSLVVGVTVTYAAMRLWIFWTMPASPDTWALPPMSLAGSLDRVAALFSFQSIGVFEKYPLYFRVSTWIVLGGLACTAWFGSSPETRSAARYAALLLAVPMAVHATFYIVDGYRDFRMLAAFHALAVLLFLSRSDLRLAYLHRRLRPVVVAGVLAVIVVNAQVTVQGATSRYRVEWQRMVGTSVDEAYRDLFATIGRHMELVPGDSSYCKTVYGPIDMSGDPRLIHLPLGFAFSSIVLTQPDQLPRLRSKYALVNSVPSPIKMLFDNSADWRVVGSFNGFTLYRSKVVCAGSVAAGRTK